MLKKKNAGLLLMIILILITAVSFQYPRREWNKEFAHRLFPKEFPPLNDGLLNSSKGVRYAPDQVLLKFKPSVSSQSVRTALAAYKTEKMKRIPKINVYQVRLPEDVTVEEMIYVMSQNPDIEYAEPNYKASITTNDTYFRHQYALRNTGQEIPVPGSPRGSERADIKATPAWGETKGDPDVLIAVIDTGIDFEHPDIQDKIFSTGRDFVNDDDDATDDEGHGTFVAGIAAASTNNNEGIAGVAWNCKILPIKTMDEDGYGWDYDIAAGIQWAVEKGAHVVNLSLGVAAYSQVLEDAVRYAFENGIVVVASAGNDDDFVYSPAAYDDYCLAVAATDYNDERIYWSNPGPEVDVAAPGVDVISLVPTWYFGPGSIPYGFGDGTSASAPHVAGLAALIKSIKPWLTPGEIMNIIRYSADDVNSADYPGNDDFIGYGRINMEKALVPIKITTSDRR